MKVMFAIALTAVSLAATAALTPVHATDAAPAGAPAIAVFPSSAPFG
ncbi:MAG: hypothetical protein AAGF90_01825 [Pseudomonadota bacterium]